VNEANSNVRRQLRAEHLKARARPGNLGPTSGIHFPKVCKEFSRTGKGMSQHQLTFDSWYYYYGSENSATWAGNWFTWGQCRSPGHRQPPLVDLLRGERGMIDYLSTKYCFAKLGSSDSISYLPHKTVAANSIACLFSSSLRIPELNFDFWWRREF
jgi:hypothetical protein